MTLIIEPRGLSAFEHSGGGPPRRSNARSLHDEASNLFRAMATHSFYALEKWRQVSISSEGLSANGLKNK